MNVDVRDFDRDLKITKRSLASGPGRPAPSQAAQHHPKPPGLTQEPNQLIFDLHVPKGRVNTLVKSKGRMHHIKYRKACHITDPTLGLVKSAILGTSILRLRKKHK
ncbi:hypothetical protein U9M48_023680 [Paspalum notatum var. saurae]|uniref:Uncharacterized protein n=1 Tax=Paspalum notatum var. saurae TaxID=547442 RepID=A0AAQ3WUX7_PASNO